MSLTCEVVAKGSWKPHVFIHCSPPGITQPRTVLMAWCYQGDVKVYLQSRVSKLLLYPNSCSVQYLHWGSQFFTCFISAYTKAHILKGHHRSQRFTELLTDKAFLQKDPFQVGFEILHHSSCCTWLTFRRSQECVRAQKPNTISAILVFLQTAGRWILFTS